MPDETQMLRTIDWRSVFPFTQLFRAFRVAIHPAKLVLALLAILLVYTAGRAMDAVWLDRHKAVPNEVALYAGSDRAEFKRDVLTTRAAMKQSRDAMARDIAVATKPADGKAMAVEDLRDADLVRRVAELRDKEVAEADKAFDTLATKTPEARAARDARVRAAYEGANARVVALKATQPQGLAITFIEYESDQIDAAAQAVLAWDWMSSRGVLASLGNFIFTGPGWAFAAHPFYFLLFTIVALLVWSVIGGAIARIAAVHVSQDEKISVRQALRFSVNKLMSFFAAPVMPLLLVGAVVLLLAVAGWLTEIPYAGGLMTIVIGAVFFVLIGVSVLVACALVGWVCGFGLMYPTIAVEGSDAFDAVSRSFSYVFARPWKIFIYSVIALVYGAVTYVFLRFLVFLTLSVLHGGLTMWTGQAGPSGHTSIASAWPGPAAVFDLTSGRQPDASSLTLAEGIGSRLLMFWTYLFATLLGAYLLSYFVSVNTIMYYLLRYDVDATEIDDVYLDPSDDEFDDASMPEPTLGTAPTMAAAESAPASGASAAVAASSVASTSVGEPSAVEPSVAETSVGEPSVGEPSVVLVSAPAPPAAPDGEPITMTQPIVDPLAGDAQPKSEADGLPPPTPPPAGS